MRNPSIEAPGPGLSPAGPFAVGSASSPRRLALIAAWAALAVLLLLAPSTTPGGAVKLDLGYEAENLVPPEDLIGEWMALIEVNSYPQPVTLRIHKVTPGKTAGKMIYASPRRCVIDLEYGGPHEGRHIFYIIRFTDCFEYESTDFVAIAKVLEEAPAPGQEADPESAEPNADAPAKESDEANAKAAPESDEAAETHERAGRILYAISLGGEERESAVLVRQ